MAEPTQTAGEAASLRHVQKGFQEGRQRREVLRDASLSLARGEQVALLGRSGSGKSTLLHLLGGLDLPDRGEVFVGGAPLHAMDEDARAKVRRREVGFVFQSYNLLPTLTVEENVRLPLELAGRSNEAGTVARSLLAEVGLEDRARAYPSRLSGGEQQRVAVVRALAHRPALVLADEPTGSLDADTGARVLELLRGMTRARGGSLVLVTHDAELARGMDRVLTLQGGVLVEVGGEVERPVHGERPASDAEPRGA